MRHFFCAHWSLLGVSSVVMDCNSTAKVVTTISHKKVHEWVVVCRSSTYECSTDLFVYYIEMSDLCSGKSTAVLWNFGKKISPSIYDILRWVAWMMGQTNHRPRVWCSEYYFFSWFLAKFFSKIFSIYLLIFFYKITKIKIKSFECPKSKKSLKK